MNAAKSHRRSRFVLSLVLAGLAVATWSGCSLLPEPKGDPTRYYVLGGDFPVNVEKPAKVPGALVVGLRAVDVPAYLGGKAMIVRSNGNEIDYREFSRWAEPLDAAITARVAERLDQSPRVARVLTYPFPLEIARDIDVKLRLLHCEGVQGHGGTAEVSIEVQILSAGGGELLASKVITAPATEWDGKSFGTLAELLGQGVGLVADDLVKLLPQPAQ